MAWRSLNKVSFHPWTFQYFFNSGSVCGEKEIGSVSLSFLLLLSVLSQSAPTQTVCCEQCFHVLHVWIYSYHVTTEHINTLWLDDPGSTPRHRPFPEPHKPKEPFKDLKQTPVPLRNPLNCPWTFLKALLVSSVLWGPQDSSLNPFLGPTNDCIDINSLWPRKPQELCHEPLQSVPKTSNPHRTMEPWNHRLIYDQPRTPDEDQSWILLQVFQFGLKQEACGNWSSVLLHV